MTYRTFSIREVGAYLHLAPLDVERLVRRAEIPHETRGGRTIFRKDAIDAWASQRILGLGQNRLAEYHRTTTAKAHDLSKEHAVVTELLHDAFVEIGIPARTKPSLLRRMVDLAARTGLAANPPDLLRSLEERERLCSTALADGMALLHPRHHEPYMFADSFIAIGTTASPIPFGAPDGKMSDIFFLVCCQDDRIHLHVLARICVMCGQTPLLSNIRNAGDPREVFECVRRSETEVIRRA